MPHQTSASWQESLQVLAASGVNHASIYMLEIDEDSRLGRELLAGGSRYHAGTVPSEELTADLYESAIAALEAHGLRQYEISNFAHSESRSRHNLKYWKRQPYLGFGLDAHSMLRTGHGSALRFCNPAGLDEYLRAGEAEALGDARRLSSSEELEEAWFLGLRMNEGVRWRALLEEFGHHRVAVFMPVVRELCELGLLSEEEDVVRLTRSGLLFSNDVFARFLADGEAAGVARQEPLIQIQ